MAHEPHFVVKYSSYLGTAIKLVLYILKQLFAKVEVNSGGYLISTAIHLHLIVVRPRGFYNLL